MTLTFTAFQHQDDLELQRTLFEDSFPEQVGTPVTSTEHYLWKFQSSPNTPPSYEYVAKEDSEILGYYAAIPYQYSIRGRQMTAGMVCDVMTHSKARGRGIFTKLGHFVMGALAETDVDFVTGYPIRPEVMGGHMRVGWTIAFQLPMYMRFLRVNSLLQARKVGWLSPLGNIAVRTYGAIVKPRPSRHGYVASTADAVEVMKSTKAADFLDKWCESIPNHLIKGLPFYTWRLGAPGTNYTAISVERNEAMSALAVGRYAVLNGVPSFALLDVMYIPGDEEALQTLWRSIDDHARDLRVEAIVVMMSPYRAKQNHLARFGLLRTPFRFNVIMRSVKSDLDIATICNEENWHLMWIDTDDL